MRHDHSAQACAVPRWMAEAERIERRERIRAALGAFALFAAGMAAGVGAMLAAMLAAGWLR